MESSQPDATVEAPSSHGSRGEINGVLLGAAFVAALGGLLFGFDTIVISGCQIQLKALFDLTDFQQGLMTASALIGTAVGALLAGKPGDLFGRRDCLKVCGLLFLVSALGCAIAWDYWSLLAFRLIGGLAVGASSVLGPLYLAEIAPAKWRGRLVAFFQINIVLGVLVAFFSNVAIDRIGFNGEEWRWKLGVEAVPAAAFLACLYFIPRSPRWLMLRGMRDEATVVFRRLRVPDVEGQVQAIQRSLHQDVHRKSEPLFVARHSRPIFLAIMVASFNQFGGINALWYYLNPILVSGGLSEESGGMATILLGVANLIATVVGMVLIDKVGRKPLLLWGAFGTLITMSTVAYIFTTGEATGLLVWLLTGVVICHAFGQGAVIWVYISEVFPNAVRAKGQTLGSFTHWFWAMVVSWTFPILAGDVGEPGAGLPFAFFAFMMILQIAVVFWLFPETKQVPLEDMETKVEKFQA